jgi:hypothetical protein
MPLLIQILFIAFFPLSSNPIHSSFIDWSAAKKLTWNDFKAAPDKKSTNAAMTSTNIKFDFSYNSDRGFEYHITCQFDPYRSWGRIQTDYILSHEQGHFDIAEIYARKLYKALKGYNPDPKKGNKELNKIYQNLMKEMDVTQRSYDKETNFSINRTEQAQWLTKIKEELKNLEAYSAYR